MALALLPSTPVLAQTAGDACVTGDPDTCSGELVLFCNPNTSVYETFDCSGAAAGTVCAPTPCTGSSCSGAIRCVGSRGDDCVGLGPVFDDDTANDNLIMQTPCVAGDACLLSDAGETCVASPNNLRCSASSATCLNNQLVICVGFSGGNAFLTSPGVVDCASFGLDCIDDGAAEGPRCAENFDPRCGTDGDGACQGSIAFSCDAGTVSGQQDCANLGQVCVDEGSPFCTTGNPDCGPLGLGQCVGNTATICASAQVVNTADCSQLGRRCGPIDASGQIGCAVIGGEGEGEGEGEAECARDSDCANDETCDDGTCRRERVRRDDAEDPPAESPLAFLGCNAGVDVSGAAGLAGLAALAAWRRRRRA